MLAWLLASAAAGAQAAGPCQFALGGSTATVLQQCVPIGSVGSIFQLAWRVATNSSGAYVTWGMSAGAGGYVAVGLPSTPGQMVGAVAFALQDCPTCDSGGCKGLWLPHARDCGCQGGPAAVVCLACTEEL